MEISIENNESGLLVGEKRETGDWTLFNMSILSKANDDIAMTLLPVMMFIVLLGVIGLTGNSLVCYIFSRKFSGGSQNFLVICLAVFDLHTCLLTIPYEIVDLRFYAYYVFESDYLCRIFKFINVFCNLGSILTLVIIAVDRYRKVCKPFTRQLRLGQIRLIFVAMLFVAIGCSTPCLFIYGFRTFNSTLVNGSVSRECSTPDGVSSWYPTIYNGFLLLNFVAISIALTCMYHGILKEVKRRNIRRKSLSGGTSQVDTNVCSINTNDDNSSTVCDEKENKSTPSVNYNSDLDVHQGKHLGDNLKQSSIAMPVLPNLVVGKAFVCQEDQKASDGKVNNDGTPACNMPNLNATFQNNVKRTHSASETGVSNLLSPTSTQKSQSLSVRRNSSDPLAGKRVYTKRTAPFIETGLTETTEITFGEASSAGFNKRRSPSRKKRRRAKHQTTMVAFSVTTVFIVSYLPYLSLMISKLVIFVGFDEALKGEGFILYNLFLRTYFINSMCNPIIYGILNSRFRLEIRRLFRSVCC